MSTKGRKNITPTEAKQYYLDYLQLESYSEVARKYGKSPSSITTAINRWQWNNPEEYKKLRENWLVKKDNEFIDKTTELISKLTNKIDEKLEDDVNYNITQLTTTLGIIYDKRQLSTGKSTSNQAVIVKMSDDLKDLAK